MTSLYGTYAKAVGFTMGGQSYGLDSVTLRLMEQVGSSSTLSVELFGGTSSSPSGPALVDFNSAPIPSLAGNVTFTPTSAFMLQGGSSYWLEAVGPVRYLEWNRLVREQLADHPHRRGDQRGRLFTDQLGTGSALEASSVMNTFQVMGSSTSVITTITGIPEPAGLIQGAVSRPGGTGVCLLAAAARWQRRGLSRRVLPG